MKHFILALTFICTALFSTAQLNIDSIGHINYDQLHGSELNDVWGYVDEEGNEYGLIGATNGTGVADLSDPSNPTEVFWEPGMLSVWRDLKTYGDYAYVTTEAQNGLLIIDLSPLPASSALSTNYYFGEPGGEWQSAHNLYVDENGYAYIFGANRGSGGVIILDVHTDPMNPVEVGEFDNWYVHDGYLRNDTLFLAHINNGFVSMVDVTDKANPVLLGTIQTPTNFSHNVWASDDGNYMFTTDELPFSYIGAYDVSDPTNIVEVDRIESSPGTGVIPHNTHVLGNYIVTSHYSDGVVIHDVTHPYNMIEVGDYDTYPDQTTTYDGCWGAYPYLPSGLILATDISEGFYVLSPDYVQGAYLEGVVTDASNSMPIDMVEVVITGGEQTEETNNVGFYATGMAASGVYDVTYSKVGYFPQTIQVDLTSGVITTQDVQLVPIPPYNLTVTVLEEGTNTPIADASIRLKADLVTHEGVANAIGEEDFILFYEEDYEVIVGHWGYVTSCNLQLIDNSTGTLTVFLRKGYYDDFSFDFGWTTGGSVSSGAWERGIPYGTTTGSAPLEDVEYDCGEYAFVTGNSSNTSPDEDDVDGGETILVSPVMDLSTMSDPYVNYTRWFYSQFGPSLPDDSLRVSVSNGIDVVQIDIVGSEPPSQLGWHPQLIRIADYISITSTMQFIFRTSDEDPDINITEAGIDLFFIEESAVGIDEVEELNVSLYPNPSGGVVFVRGITDRTEFEVRNMHGGLVRKGELNESNNQIDLQDVKTGIYFVRIAHQTLKVVKSN